MRAPLFTLLLAAPALAGGPTPWLGAVEPAQNEWLVPVWKRAPDDATARAELQTELARAALEADADDEAAEEPAPPATAAPPKRARPAAAEAGAEEDDQGPIDELDAGEAPLPPQKAQAPLTPSRSASIGKPHLGWLVNASRLEGNDRIKVRDYSNYATEEAIEAIQTAVDAVHGAHPNTQQLFVGDLSRKGGGRLKRHLSHQSGRDADISYFFKGTQPGVFKKATPRSIDLARTWTFIESLVADDKVEILFVDYRLQQVLYKYAREEAKVPEAELARVFQYPNGLGHRDCVMRHLRGHADHMHVRFRAPRALLAATEYIKKHGTAALRPLPRYYKIRRGDSLWKVARKFRITVAKLTKWNKMSKRKTLQPGMRLVVGWRRPSLPDADS